jgi:3-hydroxyisobutyrate dehydrogenase
MKIGVCGTDRMGSAIAQRLMSVGHEVSVWNRDKAKTRRLVDAGAKTSSTPPIAAGALRCYEEAEIAGLSDADPTAISSRWPNRKAKS